MKIKDSKGINKLNVKLLSESFETVLSSEISQIEDLVKVWFCGPPKMS